MWFLVSASLHATLWAASSLPQSEFKKSARGPIIMLCKTDLVLPACDIQNLATKANNTFWDKECPEILGPPIFWLPNSLQHHPPSVAPFFTHIRSEMPRVLAGRRHRWYLSGKGCGRTRPKKHKSPIGWPHAAGHVMPCLHHTIQWNFPSKAKIHSSVLHSSSHGKMQAWCQVAFSEDLQVQCLSCAMSGND